MSYQDTKRERLEAICEKKKHYPSKKQAVKIAAKIRKRWGTAVFSYKCPICHRGWLHTSLPQRRSDVTRAERGQRAPLAAPHPPNTQGAT